MSERKLAALTAYEKKKKKVFSITSSKIEKLTFNDRIYCYQIIKIN